MTMRPLLGLVPPDRARPGPARRIQGGRSQRGAAATEFALLVPALLLLFGLVVGGARIWFARAAIEQAASAAARAASVERTAGAAEHSARRMVDLQTANSGLACRNLRVSVLTGGYSTPVGTPAQVRVMVNCSVPLGDVLVPGWPGAIDLRAEADSVLDRFRGRG